jgi:ankyrin repeat protein
VRAGCDINAADITGETPLDYAIRLSAPETVAALVASGADVKRYNAIDGVSPLHLAAKRFYRSHKEKSGEADANRILLALFAAGADERQLDAKGRTAIELTNEFRDRYEKLILTHTPSP